MLINDETYKHFFRAGAADADGRIRLGLWSSRTWLEDGPDRMTIGNIFDVTCDGQGFGVSFYRAIQLVWLKSSEWTFKCNWLDYCYEGQTWPEADGPEPYVPKYRSELLDRLSAQSL